MATIAITGGTGLIGTVLTKALVERGDDVVILTRNPSQSRLRPGVRYAQWDLKQQTIDREAISAADYIVHLAGANVAEQRWTARRKKEIVDSRVKSGELLVKALQEIPNQVKAVVSSSAIGYYGADPRLPNPSPFQETDPPSNDFLGTVVKEWEAAIQPANAFARLVILRTGIVLSNEGGAYAEFRKPMRFGLSAVMGNGRQMMSWIHIDDLVRLYLIAMGDTKWSGTYNAVSPDPVTNRDLIRLMKKEQGKFSVLVPVPAFVLKAMLGEMSVEVLKSATVSAWSIISEGYSFLFPTIERAVHDLSGREA